MINYLVMGIFVNALIPAIPAWSVVVAATVAVTTLNVLGIKVVTRLNLALIAFQIVFLAYFVVSSVRQITGSDSPTIGSVFFSGGDFSLLFAGAAVLCLSFLGFDAISTCRRRHVDATRLVPRAIFVVTFVGGVMFIAVSAIATLAFPDYENFTSEDAAVNDVMLRVGGAFLETFFTAAYVAGCLASAMAAQASVGRILFAMGRDGALPRRFFGQLHTRFLTPMNALLAVAAISMAALFISLGTAAEMVSFGALVAFSMVNLAVIKTYVINSGRRSPKDLLLLGAIPGIEFFLTVWLWASLSSTATTIGLIWLGAGIAYLVWLTRGFRRPAPTLDLREVADDSEAADMR